MKTYKETKEEIKKLVIQFGIKGIYNYHLNALREQGRNGLNMQKAINFFQYSPTAAKYR